MAARSDNKSRGRSASRPREIPRSGWRDVLLRVKREFSKDNLSIVAAGVAFYAFLAIFPALAALVSLYGLVFDPAEVGRQISQLAGVLPGEARQLIEQQLQRIVDNSGGALSIGLLFGLLLTFWSAAKGTKALIQALNIAYDEKESRSFIRLNLLALALTVGAVIFVIAAVSLVVALPALLGQLGLPDTFRTGASLLRWPLLVVFLVLALAVLYHYGPSRDKPRWRWVSWGAVAASLLWLVASIAFSYYVSNFGSYNETYGSVAAIVILLLWFWITAYVVLLGAEVNSEMEHQTKQDTTEGPPEPVGQRGAHPADTVGESPA